MYLGFRLPRALSDAFSDRTLRNGAQLNQRFWKKRALIGTESAPSLNGVKSAEFSEMLKRSAKGDIGGSQVTRREFGEASWEEGRD